MVRINGLDTRWWVEDLDSIVGSRPDAILVPKISNPAQLQDLAARIVDMGTDPHIRVWAMMETPLAMINAGEIAASALDSETRLSGFVMGTNDLAKDTRARLVPGRAPMLPWLMTCVAAARAYGIDILDGVYNDLGNAEGFVEECKQARDLGFDGKTLIHPKQIEACNETFSPSPEEVENARKMIAAFDRPDNRDKGVVQIDGRMVERLHAEMAERTVAIADAIERQQSRKERVAS
jgi:citrate lyase subunit beta / citryl-CoA lyase